MSVALGLPTLLLAAPGAAQDVEALARLHHRRLPGGYYARVAREPAFFTPRAEWAGRVSGAGRGQAAAGDLRIVLIPALFADSPEPSVTADDLRRVLFDGPYAEGTLREFYTEMSQGLLAVGGTVAPWVRTSLTRAEALGAEGGFGEDARLGEYLVEALTAVDGDLDFGEFDSNGPDGLPNSPDDNGIVDIVGFYFAEVSAHCGGPGPWPHFSGITPWLGHRFETNDRRPNGEPIWVEQYVIQSAVDCAGAGVQPINAIAHELGHLLGLPDLYHGVGGILAEQRRWVVGCWSLMAAGGWGCGTSDPALARRPTGFGAWERYRLGWMSSFESVSATPLTGILISPALAGGRVVEVPLGGPERLLIEYRRRIGFDQGLPAEGVLIYRINDSIPFRPCADCAPLYRVSLVEADGNAALLKTQLEGGNRGEAGDAFGALGPGQLTNVSAPSSRRDNGTGQESDVNLWEITVNEFGARIVLSTTAIVTDRLLAPFFTDPDQLSEAERSFLDQRNNHNGRYDVGDLRAYLRRTPD
jgi:immune inhibitor A